MRSIEALNAMLAEDTASYSFGDEEYIMDCKLDGMQQVSSVVPVSYTHLDVYKRQVLKPGIKRTLIM